MGPCRFFVDERGSEVPHLVPSTPGGESTLTDRGLAFGCREVAFPVAVLAHREIVGHRPTALLEPEVPDREPDGVGPREGAPTVRRLPHRAGG